MGESHGGGEEDSQANTAQDMNGGTVFDVISKITDCPPAIT